MHYHEYSNWEKDQHAILSPSSYYWADYTDTELRKWIKKEEAKERGTRLHALAEQLINERIPLAEGTQTLNAYVNDAIGFGMDAEVFLKHSDVCKGTADALYFDEENKFLRIHDLKTGEREASFKQLIIYAALFCLEYSKEYKFKPAELTVELRIYQNDDIRVMKLEPEELVHMIDNIRHKAKMVTKWLGANNV